MESIDVLDENGLPTGLTKPKDAIHRDGDWHRAAHVWIVTNDGRVLLQKRAAAKENWPGWWDVSAAGHCSAGESAVETAVRETEEGLGITLAGRRSRKRSMRVTIHSSPRRSTSSVTAAHTPDATFSLHRKCVPAHRAASTPRPLRCSSAMAINSGGPTCSQGMGGLWRNG